MQKFKWLPSFFSALLLQTVLFAQAPIKQWDRTYGGNSEEELRLIFQTSDGGYVIGGSTRSNPNNQGGYDFQVSKLSGTGLLTWQRSFGGNKEDILTCLQPLSDGGFLIGGSSASDQNSVKSQNSWGETDYWVIRVNRQGQKLWDKRFGGKSIDNLTSLDITSDGGYILGGHSWSKDDGNISDTNRGKSDYWIIKIDENGNKLWDKRFGGVDFDEMYKVEQTTDGGYVLAGYSYYGISGDKTEQGQGNCDFWIVRTDGLGNKLWDRRFGGLDYEHLYDMTQTSDGSILLAGDSRSKISGDKSQNSRGKYDFWLVKVSGSGTKLWDRRFGGKEFEIISSLKITSDGGILMGGESASGVEGDKTQPSQGLSDFWLLKTNENGTIEWDVSFGGSDNDYLRSASETSDGGYIMAGISKSNKSGDKTQNSKGGYDYWIVKAGEPNAKKANETFNAATTNDDIKLYPNPVNDVVKVEGIDIVSLQITDNLGNIVINHRSNGLGTVHLINTTKLQSGLYHVIINTKNGDTTVQKFVKL